MTAYKKFLNLSTALNDSVGASLAYNVMACNRLALAVPPSLGSPHDSGRELTEEEAELVREAAELHSKHLAVTDSGGQFVANTNLGVCSSLLGDPSAAAAHHQEALRSAIRMQSLSGQSVAVGNLGLLAHRQGDGQTAKACLEQHLQLAQSLRCVKGEAGAWHLLGVVAGGGGEHEKAARYFEEGRRVAAANGMEGMVKRLNCLVGVAKGKERMAAHVEALVKGAEGGGGREGE